MIYVTHDQVEAMTMADKVVVLNGGKIEQVGSPLDLYHQPANLFVAGFLGTPKMGFLKGKVARSTAQLRSALDAGTHHPAAQRRQLERRQRGDPGHSPGTSGAGATGRLHLQVTADVSERLGSDTFCHVTTAPAKP
jgi:multiple sugar transport system ATP-binding protein